MPLNDQGTDVQVWHGMLVESSDKLGEGLEIVPVLVLQVESKVNNCESWSFTDGVGVIHIHVLALRNIHLFQQFIKLCSSVEQVVTVLVFVVIFHFLENHGMHARMAPELLQPSKCSISLPLLSGRLDTECSNSSSLGCPRNVAFVEWATTHHYACVTNSEQVEMLIEFTICFVDPTIDDPHFIGLVPMVSSLSSQVAIVSGGVSNL